MEPIYFTALSVLLGRRLFYMVAKRVSDVQELLRIRKERNMNGEVNFLCLEKLIIKDYNYPNVGKKGQPFKMCVPVEANDDDSWSLEEKSKAIQYLVGNVMLMRSIDDFGMVQGFDCISLEGDQKLKGGALSGGYFRKDSVAMDKFLQFLTASEAKKQSSEELGMIEENITRLETLIQESVLKKEADKLKLSRYVVVVCTT
jgi:chromosome segregation ATPase